ncbi:glycosyltransferase [Marinisporobacter balticus]|uniref:Glycosyltransferase involved in cell wall biosynthesis n=1 Tax=Marinisporobacter balticus TaxID=2018667 RepID=A0A4R2KQC4_9FIRM|nr:glycosyltransferase [Marinisporobacter balticus]TCO76461.1 glycosyltransferase involved in cell wall biosynthesis [Marinisporobacter balticus]
MKLSIAMMVKNESKYLDQCLKSLQPIMDEIDSELIIVDTGSKDDTVEIARRYTDKVYFQPWNNNFAEMRNISISYTTGEWVWILDADEIVNDPSEMISFFKTDQYKKYNSASVIIKSISDENKNLKYITVSLIRLFKKDDELKYEGVIHEQPVFKKPVYRLKTEFTHYGYIKTDKEQIKRKFERNVSLLKEQLKENPEHDYYWFQLSQSYVAYEEYEKALEYALKAYEVAKEKRKLNKSMYIYIQLVSAYFWNGQYEELEKICEEAIKESGGHIDLYFFLAKAQMKNFKNEEAVKNYHIYFKMLDHYKSEGMKNIPSGAYSIGFSDHAYAELTRLYDRLEAYDKVLLYASKIKDSRYSKKVFSQIIKAYIKLDKYRDLKNKYDREILNQNKDVINEFLMSLEHIRLNLSEKENKEIIKIFSDGEENYSILNQIRMKMINHKKDLGETLLTKIKNLDFNTLPFYYGDVIYYLLKEKYLLTNILSKVPEYKIQNFITYLSEQYDELSHYILIHLNNQEISNDLNILRINKVLQKNILVLGKLKKEDYKYVFKQYIEQGTNYIQQIYSKYILEHELIYNARNDEDAFFMYMTIAERYKNCDQVKYIQYIRKSLKVYPDMCEGVEIIIEEINELKNEEIRANKEFGAYKTKIKRSIKKLVEEGNLIEAKGIIIEYEKLVSADIEIINIKAVIAMMVNDLDEAEQILMEGLELKPFHCDVLYNLAYVYEAQEKFIKAYKQYKKIIKVANEEMIDEVIKKIEELEKIEAVRAYKNEQGKHIKEY